MRATRNCVNHPLVVAVCAIQTDAGTERYVCEVCADRFWALADAPTVTATLTYLRTNVDEHVAVDVEVVPDRLR